MVFLLEQQRGDGGWGGPEAYALVPSLSATEALLRVLLDQGTARPRLPAEILGRVTRAVDRGLAFVHGLLGSLRLADLPDTPAIEVIVPFLVARLQDHLDQLARASRRRDGEPSDDIAGLDRWRARVRLPLPRGINHTLLRGVRALLGSGETAPLKVLHSLEVADELAVGVRGVPRTSLGTVGASPAATVAWLGGPPAQGNASLRYLRSAMAPFGGPVPSVLPMGAFERAWVVNSLALAGIAFTAPRGLVTRMSVDLGSRGVSGGAGLPPDADTTSATLTALRHLGVTVRDGLLRAFDEKTHFCTWHGERTASPTTNAHVLTALALHAGRRSSWRTDAMRRVGDWLCEHQVDGCWDDKWHASPYYATACVVAGLRDAAAAGQPGRGAAAIDRATAWVLAGQRRNGSWGRFAGTAEETAYALQILLYRSTPDRRVRQAAARGYRFLLAAADVEPMPLWHDKDLYVPAHVVRAAVVGARHLAHAAGLAVPPAGPPALVRARAASG